MRFLSCLFCLLLAAPAFAEPANTALSHALSGNDVALADGRMVHLSGVAQPFDDAGRNQAQKNLQDLIADRQIVFEDAAPDRYGRLSAQIYALDREGKKIWLQGEMLKRGLAFVYPPTGFEERLDEMIAAEASARRVQAGIWADAAYADSPADKATAKEGSFAFVSGVIVDTARVKNMVYLNFGPDWRSDFTIAIAAHDLHNFRRAKIDPLELKGKTVCVRGWVKQNYGPMIAVTDPGQIEIRP